jgi:tetratricopeptide (TPR) repeat protein
LACLSSTPIDPTDPTEVGLVDPSLARGRLQSMSEMLNERRARQEIDDEIAQRVLEEEARRLLQHFSPQFVEDGKAWEYGELLITAALWESAEPVLERAVEEAANNDRRVNDLLRLARVKAHLGKVDEAAACVRQTFDVPDEDAAPILPAVLLEVVPAGEGRDREADLARLLEEAIAQHERVIVDPESQGGRMFLTARHHHIRNAWAKVIQLYVAARQDAEAERAIRAAQQWESRVGRI